MTISLTSTHLVSWFDSAKSISAIQSINVSSLSKNVASFANKAALLAQETLLEDPELIQEIEWLKKELVKEKRKNKALVAAAAAASGSSLSGPPDNDQHSVANQDGDGNLTNQDPDVMEESIQKEFENHKNVIDLETELKSVHAQLSQLQDLYNSREEEWKAKIYDLNHSPPPPVAPNPILQDDGVKTQLVQENEELKLRLIDIQMDFDLFKKQALAKQKDVELLLESASPAANNQPDESEKLKDEFDSYKKQSILKQKELESKLSALKSKDDSEKLRDELKEVQSLFDSYKKEATLRQKDLESKLSAPKSNEDLEKLKKELKEVQSLFDSYKKESTLKQKDLESKLTAPKSNEDLEKLKKELKEVQSLFDSYKKEATLKQKDLETKLSSSIPKDTPSQSPNSPSSQQLQKVQVEFENYKSQSEAKIQTVESNLARVKTLAADKIKRLNAQIQELQKGGGGTHEMERAPSSEDLQSMKGLVDDLSSENQRLLEKVEVLMKEKSDIVNQHNEMPKEDEKIPDLEATILEHTQNIAHLQSIIQSLESQIGPLRNEREQVQLQLESSLQRIEALEIEKEDLVRDHERVKESFFNEQTNQDKIQLQGTNLMLFV